MKLENLFEIFNNRIFRIPDYQRGYSWDNQQLEDLWQDLEILEQERDHYTGVLSVKKSPKEKNAYLIVDGQQRITTLIILIKLICDRLTELKDADEIWVNGIEISEYKKIFLNKRGGTQGELYIPIFGYEKDNPSDIFFRSKILNIPNTDDSTPDDTLYTKNLKNAKLFFEKKIKQQKKDFLGNLLQKITECLKFNFYKIEEEMNEFVAFETMNNRGKPLTTLELLKNRLIYISTLLDKYGKDEKKEIRNDVNNVWKTIYEYLGKNPKQIISDDDFLKDHWIMYFQYSREEANAYRKFLLDKHFTARKVIGRELDYQNIKSYALNLQESVKHYYYLHNPDYNKNYSDDLKTWLIKLNRLGFVTFKPLIMAMLVRKVEYDKIVEILKEIERFAFIGFNLLHKQSNYKNSYFYKLAEKIHHSDNPNSSQLLIDIQDLIKSNNTGAKEEFIEKIKDLENKYYDWKGIKYFLYEYELSLQEKARGGKKLQWEDINSESIEHIYPQTSTKEWKKKFKKKHESEKIQHELGNLLLMSKVKNGVLGNSPFNKKKEIYSTNSYSAIAVSKNDDWTPDTIIERTEEMFKFLESRWNINSDF